MATNYFGHRVAAANLITGEGLLHGFMASHQDTVNMKMVTFYDNTVAAGATLLTVILPPNLAPTYIMFPRRYAIPFSTGLSFYYTNVELNVWATDLS